MKRLLPLLVIAVIFIFVSSVHSSPELSAISQESTISINDLAFQWKNQFITSTNEQIDLSFKEQLAYCITIKEDGNDNKYIERMLDTIADY